MSLNLTNLFTALGRAGREAYCINGAQVLEPVPFTELAGFNYINPEWAASLALSYDSLIRSQTSPMPAWTQAAQTILLGMVSAQDPVAGRTLSSALTYLYNQMIAQSKTVQSCTIGSTVTPDTAPANVGTGAVFVTLQRGDGLIQQNVIAESSTLLITSDSYTGGQTAGQEPWSWAGAPNVSSLGTGVGCNLWDWDWPQGSGAVASGRCISAAQDATTSGNYLTNGDFETWTGGTPIPSNWHLSVGAWGTDAQRAFGGLDGGFCVQFNAGATLTALTQQFNSNVADSTLATAGTAAAVPLPLKSYCDSIWLKAGGVISGGVMKVDLVDGSGTVINDQSGAANTETIALTAHPTVWTNHAFAFRLPAIVPAIVRLRIRISTALAGATLLLDDATFAAPVNLYRGGPSVCVFSDPSTPFEANPEPDGFTLAFTNNRGGATFLATWNSLINRLFGTPDLLLPYGGSPNIADALITGV